MLDRHKPFLLVFGECQGFAKVDDIDCQRSVRHDMAGAEYATKLAILWHQAIRKILEKMIDNSKNKRWN